MKSKIETISTRPAERGLNVEVGFWRADEALADACEGPRVRASKSWGVNAIVLALVMVVAGIYAAVNMRRGWVAADDGTLSQSALRVMQGQLPHRDFGEIYTGGLSFIQRY